MTIRFYTMIALALHLHYVCLKMIEVECSRLAYTNGHLGVLEAGTSPLVCTHRTLVARTVRKLLHTE